MKLCNLHHLNAYLLEFNLTTSTMAKTTSFYLACLQIFSYYIDGKEKCLACLPKMPRLRTTSRNASQPTAAMSVCSFTLVWMVKLALLLCLLYLPAALGVFSPLLLSPLKNEKWHTRHFTSLLMEGGLSFQASFTWEVGSRMGLTWHKQIQISHFLELKVCKCKGNGCHYSQWSYKTMRM